MNTEEHQSTYKEMGAKTFYIGKSLDDHQRKTLIYQRPENTLSYILMNPEKNLLLKLKVIFMSGAKITRWIS